MENTLLCRALCGMHGLVGQKHCLPFARQTAFSAGLFLFLFDRFPQMVLGLNPIKPCVAVKQNMACRVGVVQLPVDKVQLPLMRGSPLTLN